MRSKIQTTLTAALLSGLVLLSLATGMGGQSPTRPRQAAPTLQDLPPPPAWPQPSQTPAEPKDDDYDIVRVTSNLVMVPASVTDQAGQPVLGLAAADFLLEEEGRPQEIARIGDPEQVPLEIALLLDVSGSVDARIAFEKEAAARFLQQVLRPVDRAAVFAIDQKPRLEQARATAAVASTKMMAIAPAKGPTAFYDTVVEAAQHLAQSSPAGHRRVIVAISDGEDNYSERVKAAIGATSEAQRAATPRARQAVHTRVQQAVERELQRAETTFYSINPSGEALRLNVISQRAQEGMERLAEATGGASFVPGKLEDLEAVFRRIAAELRSQYLLQYYSKDESPSGTFLRIKVQVPKQPALRVRARRGYYASRK